MTATREKLTLRWRKPAGEPAAPAAAQEEYEEVIEVATAAAVLVKAIQMQAASLDPWSPPSPLDICLECWKTWMGRNDNDLGAQGQRSLRGDGDGMGNADTFAMRRDNEIAEATDAMIDSLRACDRWAIYRLCSVTTTWNFPLLDFVSAAEAARMRLEEKLRKNVATRTLFE